LTHRAHFSRIAPHKAGPRHLTAEAGVHVPIRVDLEIMKYVDERGEKKLKFDPALEFKDPMGLQDRF